MALTPEEDKALARQARTLGIVIAAVMILWMGAQIIGGRIGLEPRFAYLFDLAAIAGFIWALVGVWQIWRRRRDG